MKLTEGTTALVTGALRMRWKSPTTGMTVVTKGRCVVSDTKANWPLNEETQSAPREITVTVTPQYEIYVNADRVPIENLEGALHELLATRPDLVGDPAIVGTANQWFANSVCDPRIAGSCTSRSLREWCCPTSRRATRSSSP